MGGFGPLSGSSVVLVNFAEMIDGFSDNTPMLGVVVDPRLPKDSHDMGVPVDIVLSLVQPIYHPCP